MHHSLVMPAPLLPITKALYRLFPRFLEQHCSLHVDGVHRGPDSLCAACRELMVKQKLEDLGFKEESAEAKQQKS